MSDGAVTQTPHPDPLQVDTTAFDYRQQSLVPLSSATHAGDDVFARASGPMAHLVKGTIEQNTLCYVMRQALPPPVGR